MSSESEERIVHSMRAVIREEIEPLTERLGTIERKLFVGNGEPSMMVQQAETRAKLDSLVERVDRKKSIRPTALPAGFWKAVGIIVLTIATAVGGVAGVKSQVLTSTTSD